MKLIKDGQIVTTYDLKTQQELLTKGYQELKEVELSEKFTVKKKGL